jgi:hypothetical protein
VGISSGQAFPVQRDLGRLHSKDWSERAAAYHSLQSNRVSLARPDVRRALLELLDRENRLVWETLRESHEHVGASSRYGEEYSEYLGELLGTVDSIADWNAPKTVCVLAHSAYEGDTAFAAKIASHPKAAWACLARMFESDLWMVRAQAAVVLTQLLFKGRDALEPSALARIKAIVKRALADAHEGVRSDEVEALGRFGSREEIPALEQIAASDSSYSSAPGGYSLREAATKAIDQIRRREK